jgi:hypothetical protein
MPAGSGIQNYAINKLLQFYIFTFIFSIFCRSPGGTPIKPKSRKRESVSDPASVIAQALKKKFANQIIHSPDIDKENDSHGFSSPETNSPHYVRPFFLFCRG